MAGWLCLFIASLCQVAWTYSLKYLDFKRMQQADWSCLYALKANFFLVLPLLGYIVFGLLNSYFLSVAMKSIPASTTLAVWLGLAVIGIKATDLILFRDAFNAGQLVYMILIISGVIGLKISTPG